MYKVVVIEDESIERNGIVRSVNWGSANCMVMGDAEDGEKGMALIRKVNPDIVVSDISMPGMDGIEMLEKLYDEGIRPKIIFLTAYDNFDYARKALRLQACDYILKPFKDGEIETVLNRITDELKASGQNETQFDDHELKLKKGDKSKYLDDAISYINENYANPDLSIEMVAGSIGISSGHLSRLFRKETEYTMMTYLINQRMRAAKDLLKDYSHKVYEVAELVGYRDITYFSATFKKYVGVSPSEYQDRYKR